MSTIITVYHKKGTYIARAAGHKGTASHALSARLAANGMAFKMGLDFTLLHDQGEEDGNYTFTHPQERTA
ncbi:hypothetical protein ACIQVE_07285 [Pseudomonas sp. NPDC098747]|uniref:hypothetical protein n=1 Tax=Pseudomonas sp. NPDC098747 TaxID=3364487 RepID=UPI00383AF9C7